MRLGQPMTVLVTCTISLQQLKLLRHPYIVRFLSWKKTSTGGQLVTEPVKPLESVIDSLTALEISAGLYNVIDAVTFLHDKVRI